MKFLNHEELVETARNPVELRRHYQSLIMHWRKLAHQNRKKSRQQALTYPIQGYKDVFQGGYKLMDDASVLDSMADIYGQCLDTFVRTTLEPAICTCHKTLINDTNS